MATKKKADQKIEEWRREGRTLRASQHQWVIADWILRGIDLFKSKIKAYDAAVELTGMTRGTLHQFKMTAEFFPADSSTRVKELFFGHHRLVAKEKYKDADRKRFLRTAVKRKMNVVQFDAYLKNREKNVERQENTPTNGDAAAEKVVELCHHLRDHLSIRALYKSDPPKDMERRKNVIDELRATADQLIKNAEWLATNWQQFDLVHYSERLAEAARTGR
jgi:hypothetical protein